MRDTTEVIAAVVLGRAIVFAHGTTLPADELPGLRVRPVEGLTPSTLEIGVPAGARNPLAERFVAHARAGWAPAGR
ncbi:hypothetical protein Asp14428_15850 [Actinoplanes sp. NBRC 14428]|nr:hypothetical protein Asp14428_15850 [Actinoplanes sp. NBRC 14428]